MFGQVILISRFAIKTLLHERAKTIAGVGGVAFAVCLALVQFGMYLGSMAAASAVIDRSTSDLWVVPRGAQNFDFTQIQTEYLLYLVRSVPGVARVEPVLVGFALWQLPTGGMESVEVVGFLPDGEMLRPWNVRTGQIPDIFQDRNVIVDGADLKKLQVQGIGDHTEIFLDRDRGMLAKIIGLTSGVKSFVASPVVMTGYDNALAYTQRKQGEFTYLLIRVAPGYNHQEVKQAINQQVPRLEAYTRLEFAHKTQRYWDEATGLGMALFASATLGVLVGVGTVAMILYMSTIDHLPQFATLKALGVPNYRVVGLVTCQAMMVGMVGFGIGLMLALYAQENLKQQALYVLLTPRLVMLVFLGTILFCALASLLSAVKIIRIDPAMVFHG